MTPKFKHDCDTCRFLGHHYGYDVYVCEGQLSASLGPSIIARYGDEGLEYASGIVDLALQGIWTNGEISYTGDGKACSTTWEEHIVSNGGDYHLAWLVALSKDWYRMQQEAMP